jgi:hypothetical protein
MGHRGRKVLLFSLRELYYLSSSDDPSPPPVLIPAASSRLLEVPLRLAVSCGGVGGKATKGTGSERD